MCLSPLPHTLHNTDPAGVPENPQTQFSNPPLRKCQDPFPGEGREERERNKAINMNQRHGLLASRDCEQSSYETSPTNLV